MDDPLRNALWNVVYAHYLIPMQRVTREVEHERRMMGNISLLGDPPADIVPQWMMSLWLDYRYKAIDDIPSSWSDAQREFRQWFVSCPWYEAYDVVEFLSRRSPIDEEANLTEGVNAQFVLDCNSILDRYWAGYRFVAGQVTPVIDDAEIDEIERAVELIGPLAPAAQHIHRALELLSDRSAPDYRNSIKESISAVESVCRAVTGERRGVLSKSLRKLEERGVSIHPAMREAFEKLYGYTGDEDGIRHAMTELSNVDREDAQFMLVSCSAFANYLIGKATQAGIELSASNRQD